MKVKDLIIVTSGLFFFSAIFLAASNEAHCQDSLQTKQYSLKLDTMHQSKMDSSQAKEEQLQKFRKAFKKLVEARKIKQKKEVQSDPSLNLGVMVFNETRTKIGRDFYNLFYQNWHKIKNASSFTITIGEKPSPGLGSIVSIKIDYDLVFRARLQPRYQYIKAMSEKAVARCRNIIKRKAKVRKQLTGY